MRPLDAFYASTLINPLPHGRSSFLRRSERSVFQYVRAPKSPNQRFLSPVRGIAWVENLSATNAIQALTERRQVEPDIGVIWVVHCHSADERHGCSMLLGNAIKATRACAIRTRQLFRFIARCLDLKICTCLMSKSSRALFAKSPNGVSSP